jgi:hypothetical protein
MHSTDPAPPGLERQAVLRVLESRHFAKAPLLSSFLTYVCRRALEDGQLRISEHEIALHVFHRTPDFDPSEDNIVRTYARNLRKRLEEYHSAEGQAEFICIEIPKGGYVPIFTKRECVADARPEVAPTVSSEPVTTPRIRRSWNRWLAPWSVAALLAMTTVGLLWSSLPRLVAVRTHALHPDADIARPLWVALFGGSANTYIVPADAGLSLLQDLSHKPLPLANYIKGSYFNIPLPNVGPQGADDLHTQQYTSFVDLQIEVSLARLPEFDPKRVIMRFPRDLRLDDLKNDNAILLGSGDSDPWVELAERNTNFRIVNQEGMKGVTVVNIKPRPGEAAFYASHWDEPSHETYGVIAYLPNLGSTGHLLLLQGLDVAGTQAAAEALFQPKIIATILERATRSDGSLRSFEILLRSTSIESNATGTQVVASRIH